MVLASVGSTKPSGYPEGFSVVIHAAPCDDNGRVLVVGLIDSFDDLHPIIDTADALACLDP